MRHHTEAARLKARKPLDEVRERALLSPRAAVEAARPSSMIAIPIPRAPVTRIAHVTSASTALVRAAAARATAATAATARWRGGAEAQPPVRHSNSAVGSSSMCKASRWTGAGEESICASRRGRPHLPTVPLGRGYGDGDDAVGQVGLAV